MAMKKKEQDTSGGNLRLEPAFRAMADSTRLKILLMLEAQPRTVGEIVSFFNLSQPTITRHLQTLTSAGLVRWRRQGQHVTYELNADNLRLVCTDLVACFPCCCITVSTDGKAVSCASPKKVKISARPASGASRTRGHTRKTKQKGG